MVSIIGVIAALTVLGISLVITRIASTALSLTGLSLDAARFLACSAFTGTGFTTREAKKDRLPSASTQDDQVLI